MELNQPVLVRRQVPPEVAARVEHGKFKVEKDSSARRGAIGRRCAGARVGAGGVWPGSAACERKEDEARLRLHHVTLYHVADLAVQPTLCD